MEPITRIAVVRFSDGDRQDAEDAVVVEEPLEIRLGEKPVSVTLRTPGDDFDLAAGFLFSESILRDANEIASIRHWGSPNVVRVDLREGVQVDLQRLQRHFYSTSSCGVCGKTSIDALRVQTSPIVSDMRVARRGDRRLAGKAARAAEGLRRYGGIHAAGIFAADGHAVALA